MRASDKKIRIMNDLAGFSQGNIVFLQIAIHSVEFIMIFFGFITYFMELYYKGFKLIRLAFEPSLGFV